MLQCVLFFPMVNVIDRLARFQGGDKIPRKGGPGISQSDLLVINKARHFSFLVPRSVLKPFIQIDIAEYVNASLEVMQRDARLMRGDGPTVFTSIKKDQGVEDVVDLVLGAWRTAGSPGTPGPVVL